MKRIHADSAVLRLRPGRISLVVLVLVGLACPVAGQGSNDELEQLNYWHQWRGPLGTGVAPNAKPPTTWSEEENVRWKVKIDGAGSSTPIVWGDQVFLLSAINTGEVEKSLPKPEDQPDRVFGIKYPNTFYEFVVICLDRDTGQEKWRQTAARRVPHEGHHGDNDFASASPVTDGKRLYCWFGSIGLYCYGLDGDPLWRRDLGPSRVGASLGEGCSPVLYKDKLIIVRDHAGQSSIEVVQAHSGQTVWKKSRDEDNAWATPAVVEHNGITQVITTASNRIRSYDLSTGDLVWECSGLTGNCIPCPVVIGDHVICMSGYEGYSVMSVSLDSQGDVSDSDAVNWQTNNIAPYIPSPVLYRNRLYFNQSNNSIWTCLDARNGATELEKTRLPGLKNIYASPVAADGRLYVLGRGGKTLVLAAGPELEVLAENQLEERFDASPAIAGRQLFLRGESHLYCLEVK